MSISYMLTLEPEGSQQKSKEEQQINHQTRERGAAGDDDGGRAESNALAAE